LPEKIEHIRKLSESGLASEIFIENKNSLRILDNITFKDNKKLSGGNMPVDTSSALAGYKLSVPVYLGDMSYGAIY